MYDDQASFSKRIPERKPPAFYSNTDWYALIKPFRGKASSDASNDIYKAVSTLYTRELELEVAESWEKNAKTTCWEIHSLRRLTLRARLELARVKWYDGFDLAVPTQHSGVR